MKTDYSAYPPQIAADVEIVEQRDGERLSYVVGAASVGRYIILRATEYKVLQLLREKSVPATVCERFKQEHGVTLRLATLTRFLAKLDEVGILAGERARRYAAAELLPGQQFYHRLKFFDPDRFFTRLVRRLWWVWTVEFAAGSLLLMLVTLLLALSRWDEVADYGAYTLREHFLPVVAASWLVVITHEFAHGLTCKAFGGRATEVGALLIYYFLPALYCNVSGIHLIPKRGQRLWVIAAGVYWQLLVGMCALLGWIAFAPYTLPADLAFIFFLGSVLDIVFNANPLIKLDGYYFLSQWLRLPNLMNRSRAYWRGLLRRILLGEHNESAVPHSRRERRIYFVFGLLSFLYNFALPVVIVCYVGKYLIDSFYLFGLLLSVLIALVYGRRPLKQIITAGGALFLRLAGAMKQTIETAPRRFINKLLFSERSEANMASQEQTLTENPATKPGDSLAKRPHHLRRLVPLALAVLVIVVLVMPWSASVGSYGTLIALPEQETIIRAPESATLMALTIRPGQQVSSGAKIGQMGSSDLQEQLIQVQSELARVTADYEYLLGELHTQTEAAERAGLQLRQRQRDYQDSDLEQRQINERLIAEQSPPEARVVTASTIAPTASRLQSDVVRYPAAIAVLQSDLDQRRAQYAEASAQRDRVHRLFVQGVVSRTELEAAQARAVTLGLEVSGAQERLDAALIEHRRGYLRTTTEMDLARTDVNAGRLQIEKLNGQLSATRELIHTLEQREQLLRQKQAQFELVTPSGGVVFGEELPRMVGQYFQKGTEVCRVADTRQLLVRIKVPEREIGDVQVGRPVRLKATAFPDVTFQGAVTKIGAEAENDEHGQPAYRVELTVENAKGWLRPGMTVFARIEFGRRTIGQILLHKVRQALRPELWLF